MPFKFFSIPGVSPIRDGGRGRDLPPLDENPNLKGWLEDRSETSHGVLGLDPGMNVDLDLHGEHRNATVIEEVGDPKSGKADVYVRSQGNRGSEIHKVSFEPDGARSMIQPGHPQKVKKAP